MTDNALELFIARTRSTWGPLSSDLAAGCRRNLEQLAKAPATESWLAALHEEAPTSKELYRDATHGFMLMAHTEPTGLYRPPHDHGRSWVIYALERGEIVMSSYARVENHDREVRLVKRDETLMRAGQAMLFLPGDIHDTRCLSGPALLLRFTERDLTQELAEQRLTRYVERNGVWTVGQP